MRPKRVCQERDVNISLINVIDSASRCYIFPNIINNPEHYHNKIYLFIWLCWGLTSQSTIFQSCWDGAIASWVINQYFRGVKCLAQGHNTATVGLEPRTSRSGVRHSTTEPPRSPDIYLYHLISFINLFTLINDRHQLIDQLIVLMDDKPRLISGHKALVRNFQNHDFRCIAPSFF